MTQYIHPSPNPLHGPAVYERPCPVPVSPPQQPEDLGPFQLDTRPAPRERFGVRYEVGFIAYIYDRRRQGWVYAGYGTTRAVAESGARGWIRGALRAAGRSLAEMGSTVPDSQR